MSKIPYEVAVLDEALWRAWLEHGRKRERATARRMKIAAVVLLIVAALGVEWYRLAIR